MSTIFSLADREALLARADRLAPDSVRKWGRMTVGEMVCHLVESLRMASGEVRCTPRGGPLSFPPIRWLVLHVLPIPRGAPTAPELLAVTPAAALDDDLARLRHLIEQVAARGPGAEFPPHPAFGRMNGPDWGILIHKHVDHHLRQFSV